MLENLANSDLMEGIDGEGPEDAMPDIDGNGA